MSRRTPGEGSIIQRKDGRWQASLQVAGVRRTVYGRTRAEVAGRLEELKRQAVGGLPDPGKRTVADLIAAWLDVAASSLRPKTLADYTRLCSQYVLPVLGDTRLSRLEPAHIERLLAGIQRRGHRRTAQLVYVVLHRACTYGIRWRWLAGNPTARVPRPGYQPTRRAVWTPEQLRTFLGGTRKHWLFPLWHTLIATGCRIGEALALTWADVDLDAATVHIDKTLQQVGGQVLLGGPKTNSGTRTIALPADAVDVLRMQRGRQVLAGRTTELVFPSTDGRPLQRRTVQRALKLMCLRLGVPCVTPHGLRHLHASLLLDQGLPLPAVSARLGHANPNITARVYAHLVGRRDDAGADLIARAMRGE